MVKGCVLLAPQPLKLVVVSTTSPLDAARADGSRFGLAVGRQPVALYAPHSLPPRHRFVCITSILFGTHLSNIHAVCWITVQRPTPAPHCPSRVVHRPLSRCHFTPEPPLFISATIRQTICDDTRFRQHCKAHLARHPAHHVGSLLAIQLRVQTNTVLHRPVRIWLIAEACFLPAAYFTPPV